MQRGDGESGTPVASGAGGLAIGPAALDPAFSPATLAASLASKRGRSVPVGCLPCRQGTPGAESDFPGWTSWNGPHGRLECV